MSLAESMAGDMRLQGDVLTYDDPANADIIAVWERRRGLPVALGLLYLDAARRCELPVQGVDFPGHFLLRIEADEGPLALDTFSEGRVVLPSELIRRALRAGLTPDVADRLDVLMAPVKDRAVVLRLENNIKVRLLQAGEIERAVGILERMLLIAPGQPLLWFELGGHYAGRGKLRAAMEALERCSGLAVGESLGQRAEMLLRELRGRLN